MTGFALFAMFLGAGNLLLPPLLGYNSGNDWFVVTIGFVIAAVVIPILGILAHARLQGTMYDFGKKVSPTFSFIYCILVYLISIAIPSPRTASATHEIAIYPFFGTDPLLTSSIYFALVLIFVLNRSKILSVIGKYLTPLIVITLFLVIMIGLFSSSFAMNPSTFDTPIVGGLLEGYQTFDAIGAVLVGGVIIISLDLRGHTTFEAKYELIKKSGLIAGFGLLIVYAGLISVGAIYGNEIIIDSGLSNDMQRATLLRGISSATLGDFGNTILSTLIAIACFTTAVGIVTGTADYFKGVFKGSQLAYIITAFISCIFGIIVGQLDFHSIIIIGLPILMFIYPITIILIFLNVLPEQYSSKIVFRGVVTVAFLFSLPEVIKFIYPFEGLNTIQSIIPLSQYTLGWVLPSLFAFLVLNIKSFSTKKV